MIQLTETLYLDSDEHNYIIGKMIVKTRQGVSEEEFVASRYFGRLESLVRYLADITIKEQISSGSLKDCLEVVKKMEVELYKKLGLTPKYTETDMDNAYDKGFQDGNGRDFTI